SRPSTRRWLSPRVPRVPRGPSPRCPSPRGRSSRSPPPPRSPALTCCQWPLLRSWAVDVCRSRDELHIRDLGLIVAGLLHGDPHPPGPRLLFRGAGVGGVD